MITCRQLFLVLLCALILHSAAFSIVPTRLEEIKHEIPLLFTRNAGQWNKDILFASLQRNGSTQFTRSGVTFIRTEARNVLLPSPAEIQRRGENATDFVSYHFVKPSRRMTVSASETTPTVSHFYLGDKRDRWREHVPNYQKLLYQNVWEKVDIEFTQSAGLVKQTFVVHPGGNLSDIQLQRIRSSSNDLTSDLKYASASQEVNGIRIPVGVNSSKDKSGAFRFKTGTYNPALPLIISTEFSTFFGGSGAEQGPLILVDRDGGIVIGGTTGSVDLPVVNAVQPTRNGTSDLFLAKFYPDGKSLAYCTYFGGSSSETSFDIELGADYSIVFVANTYSNNFPLTANAALKTQAKNSISRFNCNGLLWYSSYLWDSGLQELSGMTTDFAGFVYLIAHTYTTPPMTTPNALFPKNQGSEDAFIMKITPDCDFICYATCFGGTGHEEPGGIAVDQWGNIFITGVIFSGTGFPLVKPFQDKIAGGYDMFIAKINCTGNSIVFSSYLGGSGQDNNWGSIYPIVTDLQGNVYVTGTTTSSNFPLANPFSNKLSGSSDAFISKISPDGRLVYSTYLGGSGSDNITGLSIDPCGNMIITGSTTSPNYPLVSERQNLSSTGTKGFISVLDSTGRNMTFSTHWGKGNYLGLSRKDDHIYVAGASLNPADSIRIFNAFQDTRKGGADVFISKLQLSKCSIPDTIPFFSYGVPSFSIRLDIPDSILVERTRLYISPEKFTVRVVVRNTDSAQKISISEGELLLPAGLFPSPPNQPLKVQSFDLTPGDSIAFSWQIAVKREKFSYAYFPLSFKVSFSGPVSVNCALMKEARKDIPIRYYDMPPYEVQCELKGPDSLILAPDKNSYLPDPFSFDFLLRNLDSRTVPIGKISLILPKGMGTATIPANDTIRSGTLLSKGMSLSQSWILNVKRHPSERTLRFQVVVKDTFDYEITRCDYVVFVPPITTISCHTSGPEKIVFIPKTGKTIPDSIQILLFLQNHMDTVQYFSALEIDLSKAPHLQFAPGESVSKLPFMLFSNQRKAVWWQLRILPPVTETVLDTIFLWYMPERQTIPDYCMFVIKIEPLLSEVLCNITTVDTLEVAASGDRYLGNPFQARLTVKNTGTLSADISHAIIDISPPLAVVLQDQFRKDLSAIQPGDSVSAVWNVLALTSLYSRDVLFSVNVYNTSGNRETRCETPTNLPRIPNNLACDILAPDTLRYDVKTDTYTPDPFQVSVSLTNKLDTAQNNVEAEIDLTGAQHLELVSGETAMKQLPDIIARGQSSVAWNVTIKSSTDKPVTETILVRYRSANEQEWKTCERTILIQGEKRIRSAKCSVKGHDTLWADIRYEDIIPQPAQVQYTITNTGNVPLTGCSAAIILPSKYELEPGCDSVQTYGIIPPGMSTSREWFITVNKLIALPGTDDIQWTWTCDDMTTEIPCRHAITLAVGIPHSITLTPWKLRFMAKQDGPLPAHHRK